MSSLRKYIIVQIVLSLVALAVLFAASRRDLQYVLIFFVVSLGLFILATHRPLRDISQYLKDNFPDLYKRRTTYRKFLGRDLAAVNIWGFQKSALSEIKDENIVRGIEEVKVAQNVALVTMVTIFILLVIKTYL